MQLNFYSTNVNLRLDSLVAGWWLGNVIRSPDHGIFKNFHNCLATMGANKLQTQQFVRGAKNSHVKTKPTTALYPPTAMKLTSSASPTHILPPLIAVLTAILCFTTPARATISTNLQLQLGNPS